VGVATPDLARQLLNARQLDEINVNLVPVLLGGGVALFANLASAPIRLHGPTVIEGTGVTHLNYRVTYSRPRGHLGAWVPFRAAVGSSWVWRRRGAG